MYLSFTMILKYIISCGLCLHLYMIYINDSDLFGHGIQEFQEHNMKIINSQSIIMGCPIHDIHSFGLHHYQAAETVAREVY